MKKIKAEQDEVIPKNIRDQTNKEVEIWEKRDRMFVSTRASAFVMKCLQDNSCVTLTGSSGVGKSFIAQHSALVLRKEGYSIMPVYLPSDIRSGYQLGKQTVFIVDDICGNFTASQQQIENWKQLLPVIRNIVEENCCKIIVSCRLQVYKDDKFNILSLFKSCECNLISDELCLTSVEKRDIADMYMGTNSKNLSEEAKGCEFFPLLCYLYHINKDDITDLNEFFEHPFNIYQTEFDNLARHGDEGKYKVCSLALCVLFDNRLEEKWFQGTVTDQQRQILEDTCAACRLNRSTSKAVLKEALNTLEGTFICKKNGIYRTLHDKLFDFLAHYFGQIMIECLIVHGDKYFIEQRFLWQNSSYDKTSKKEFIVEITGDYLETYLERLIKDWSEGMVKRVFDKKDMKVSSFRQHLLHHLLKLDKSKQITLSNTKDTFTETWTTFPGGSFCNSGDLPLIRACKHGYTDIVKWILNNGVDVNQCRDDRMNALYMACKTGHITILNMLLEKNANVDQCNFFGDSLLNKACEIGRIDIVKLLLENNCTIDLSDNGGFTPLITSCCRNNISIVQLLLQHKPDINAQTHKGITALSYACEREDTDIVNILLEQNANVDLCDNNGVTPLIKSCLNDHTSTVQLLLKHKPDINARTFDGGSALFFSALNGNLKVTQLLLENSADCNMCFNSKDTFNTDALINRKQRELFEMLVKKTSTNAANYVIKISNDYISMYENYSHWKMHKNSKSEYYALNIVAGSSPLQIACFMGGTNVVRCLLEHESNINMINKAKEDGTTPISYACEVGHTDIVQILLDQNANIESRDNDGFTPLITSCLNNHTSTAQLLIKHKPYVNARTENGTDALFFSALNGNLEITQLLLENNADCNNCIHSKQLFTESLSDHPNQKETVHQRTSNFLDFFVNGVSAYVRHYFETKSLDYVFDIFVGSSSLHIACFMGRLDVVHCLLENKANINKANDHGTTPLSYACELGHTDIVKLLLDKHAILDSFDNDGFTPLTISCFNSNISEVQLLIKHKSDINAQTYDGSSALFFSTLNGNLEINQLLLENSADLNICFHSKDRIIKTLNNHALFTKKKHNIFQSLITSTSKNTADYLRGKYLDYKTLSFGYTGVYYGNRKSVDYAFDVLAGSSPLHIACFMGKTEVVRCLLEHESNINKAKEDGTTALSYACEVGYTEIVKILLEKNANVDHSDNNDFTPLIKSCMNNHTSTIQLLIKHKPDINAKAFYGLNALFFSALNGNLEIIQLLLKNSADCNICCDSKECVKETSANLTMKTLKQKKQDIFNIVNHLSSIANDYLPAPSRRLNNYGQDEVKENEKAVNHVFDVVAGSSPLHIACFIGRIDVVRCLLEHKANINIKKEDGTTPLHYACNGGHADIVKLLLEKNVYVDICDNNGFTPLIKSCLKNNISTIQLLMKHKPDINARTIDGANGLFFSALNGNKDITQILLQNNADCNICIYSKERMICTFKDRAWKSFEQEKRDLFDIFRSICPLNIGEHVIKRSHYQFWTKSLDYVRIRKKAVEYVFSVVAGSSPLHIASFMGRTDVVRCLLKHKADINITKEDGTTPLSYACEVGHTDIVKLLLDQNANIDLCDNDDFTPLIKACMNNHTSVVQLLIQHKPDITARASNGFDALFSSAMNGYLEIVKLLLNSTADCNICSDSKEFIKDASVANNYDIDGYKVFGYGNEKSVEYDNEESVDSEEFIDPVFDLVTSSTPLHIACFTGEIDVVRCLLEHKAYIDMAKENGETSLSYACKNGHSDIVKLLLEKNANVNMCTNDGRSPLYNASLLGHTDKVRMLLEKTANVDLCDKKGVSPLYGASHKGHTDIVRMLLEKNANVDLCDNDGVSPLYGACHIGHTDIVMMLLEKNANVDLFETTGLTTALTCSCFHNKSSIVKLLIKHKPDINAQAIDGNCALFLSALNGNVKIVRLLLKNNADCNICCHSKQSIKDKLSNKSGFDNLTQNIYVSYLKKASSLNVLDYVNKNMSKSKEYAFDVVAGSSPLHIACFNGFIDVVRCLLRHKANINMTKEDGTTPLFYACEVGHEDIVQLLLDTGADTQICRLDGKFPLNIATDNEHESVEMTLRKYIEDQHTISF